MKVNRLTESVVYNCRKAFWSMSYNRRIQWLYDKVSEAREVNGRLYFSVYSGTRLCATTFRNMYRINKNTYYRALQRVKEGAIAPGGPRKRKRSQHYVQAMDWLEDYVTHFADRMPNIQRLYLPYGSKKSAIYDKYKEESGVHRAISRSSFYQMWHDHFKNVKIKKVSK